MTKRYEVRVLYDKKKNKQKDYDLLTSLFNSEEVPFKTYPFDDAFDNGPTIYIKKTYGKRHVAYNCKELKENKNTLEKFVKDLKEVHSAYLLDSLPFSD